MSNHLSGLCNRCIASIVNFRSYLKSGSTNIPISIGSASAIPQEFMAIAKIMELLSSNTNLSSAASSIMSSAITHQEMASESQIGLQVC